MRDVYLTVGVGRAKHICVGKETDIKWTSLCARDAGWGILEGVAGGANR